MHTVCEQGEELTYQYRWSKDKAASCLQSTSSEKPSLWTENSWWL